MNKNPPEKWSYRELFPVFSMVMLSLLSFLFIAGIGDGSSTEMSTSHTLSPPSFDVQIVHSGHTASPKYSMQFTHLSGEPIDTHDLAIVTAYTNKSGYTYRHEQTRECNLTDIRSPLYLYGAGPFSYHARVPYLNDMRAGYPGGSFGIGNPAPDFGNFTWHAGDVMDTGGEPGLADLLGMSDNSSPHAIRDPDFGPGSRVTVSIIQVPLGKILLDTEVVVPELEVK